MLIVAARCGHLAVPLFGVIFLVCVAIGRERCRLGWTAQAGVGVAWLVGLLYSMSHYGGLHWSVAGIACGVVGQAWAALEEELEERAFRRRYPAKQPRP